MPPGRLPWTTSFAWKIDTIFWPLLRWLMITRVLKQGETFAVFDRYGDIQALGLGEQGLYHEGTRFLSRFVLRVGRNRPLLLSSTVRDDNTLLTVDLTNPDFTIDGQVPYREVLCTSSGPSFSGRVRATSGCRFITTVSCGLISRFICNSMPISQTFSRYEACGEIAGGTSSKPWSKMTASC